MLRSLILIVVIASFSIGCDRSGSSQKSIINPYKSQESGEKIRDCGSLEPENPYSPGSGHYAGFEWASEREVSSCGGNSDSFIEGCEDYLRQEQDYTSCMNH